MTTYNKETGSSVTGKNEQFGFDIFADDENIDADSVAYYCDGADAMWNEIATSVTMTDELGSSVTMINDSELIKCNNTRILCNSIDMDLWGRTYYRKETAS